MGEEEVPKEQAGWLKRLKKSDGEQKEIRIVREASRVVKRGHIHTVTLGCASSLHSNHRGRVTGIGFMGTSDRFWSVGNTKIVSYALRADGKPDVLKCISAPRAVEEITGACLNGTDKLYCLTPNDAVFSVSLSAGVVDGYVPSVGRKGDQHRFVKICSASPKASFWYLIAMIDDRGAISVIDTRTNQVVRKFISGSQTSDLCFLPEGNILTGDSRGDVFEWDLNKGRCISRHHIEGSLGIKSMCVRAHDNTLLVSDLGSVVTQHTLEPVSDGKKRFELIKEYRNLGAVATGLFDHPKHPLVVAYSDTSSDAVKLVSNRIIYAISFQINIEDKYVYQNWPGERFDMGKITAGAFCEKDGFVALGSAAGVVKLWRFDNFS